MNGERYSSKLHFVSMVDFLQNELGIFISGKVH